MLRSGNPVLTTELTGVFTINISALREFQFLVFLVTKRGHRLVLKYPDSRAGLPISQEDGLDIRFLNLYTVYLIS